MERAPEIAALHAGRHPFLPFSGKKDIADSSLRRPNFLNPNDAIEIWCKP